MGQGPIHSDECQGVESRGSSQGSLHPARLTLPNSSPSWAQTQGTVHYVQNTRSSIPIISHTRPCLTLLYKQSGGSRPTPLCRLQAFHHQEQIVKVIVLKTQSSTESGSQGYSFLPDSKCIGARTPADHTLVPPNLDQSLMPPVVLPCSASYVRAGTTHYVHCGSRPTRADKSKAGASNPVHGHPTPSVACEVIAARETITGRRKNAHSRITESPSGKAGNQGSSAPSTPYLPARRYPVSPTTVRASLAHDRHQGLPTCG